MYNLSYTLPPLFPVIILILFEVLYTINFFIKAYKVVKTIILKLSFISFMKFILYFIIAYKTLLLN